MDLGLSDQVAVIVGGARGLGLAIAEGFGAEGCRVALIDRDAGVEATSQRFAGGQAQAIQADATEFSAMRDAAARIRQHFGRCDHIVYAAAIGSGKFGFPFWNLEPADWDRVLRVNVIGAVNTAHAFAPALAEARAGTLLMIASVAGQMGSQTDPPYSASKAALINFSQCAAKDLAPYGVRVNALCPGMVQTALNRSVYESWATRQPEGVPPGYEAWAAEKIRVLVPLNRWQTPQDIATMAVFLASARAKEVTGQTINVDGGYVMHW